MSIKQTQTQPQYSMPHGRRRVMTPLTRDQIVNEVNMNSEEFEVPY